jgi:predicted AlkP superfamily pyrophosphatase or phosphodiesterase
MNRGANIFDELERRELPYFASDPDVSEEANRDRLANELAEGTLDFAFMYWAGLDGLLHRVGNTSPEVPAKLREYERWIQTLMDAAAQHYDEVHLYVFSDHGMANCTEHVDLMSQIQPLNLEFGEDYAAVYDSTMARFWFFNEPAREKITALLARVPQGRILPEAELKSMRAPIEGGYFGELIFLLHEGALLVPSHMGERPITAMHGYHPGEPQSYAALFTNQAQLPEEVTAIPHIHRLMMHEVNQKQSAHTAGKPRIQALHSA